MTSEFNQVLLICDQSQQLQFKLDHCAGRVRSKHVMHVRHR